MWNERPWIERRDFYYWKRLTNISKREREREAGREGERDRDRDRDRDRERQRERSGTLLSRYNIYNKQY